MSGNVCARSLKKCQTLDSEAGSRFTVGTNETYICDGLAGASCGTEQAPGPGVAAVMAV